MDISSSGIQPGGIRDSRGISSADSIQRKSRPSVQSRQESDEASISERALLLQKTREALADTPDVREEKVAALQVAVELGIYRPSPAEIARAMLGLKESR